MNKTRLLFLFSGSGLFRYGVAEVFRHVLNGLDKDRYKPCLVITGTLAKPVDGLSDAVEIIELHQKGLKKAFFPLVRTLRAIRPDIVISAMEHPNVMAVLARMVSRHHCKLVLTSHNVFTPRLQYMWSRSQGRMIRKSVQWTYALADHLVCVSDAVRTDLSGYVKRMPPTSVIHNPVLKEASIPASDRQAKVKGLIAISSRLEGYKKIDEAIHALRLLDSHFRLAILGDGPERRRLESLVEQLDLWDRVEFKGYVDDPFIWYRKAEILVLPSMWEGFGNVLIESMACGCQVVANSLAWAPPEVLGYGEYGFLYDGGDPRALALAIQEATDNPKPLESLIEYARKFTDKRVARQYEALMYELLSTD